MRRVFLIAVALTCGCKAKRKAAPPPADAEIVDDAEPVEIEAMADAVAAGAIEVTFEQQTGAKLSGNVLYVDELVTASRLVIENKDEDATIALPRYVLARLPGYVYPWSGEGCLPPNPWLIAAPEDTVEVAAGERVELPVTTMWYLGNAERPPPSAGDTSRFTVTAVTDQDPLARLADAVADDPQRGKLAFAAAGGCTPEPWLTDSTLKHFSAGTIAGAERALDAAGLDASRSPVFAAARDHRRDTIAALRADPGKLVYAASDPDFLAFFQGDVEVAKLAAAALVPDRDGRYPALVVQLLERLEVTSPTVAEALTRAKASPPPP